MENVNLYEVYNLLLVGYRNDQELKVISYKGENKLIGKGEIGYWKTVHSVKDYEFEIKEIGNTVIKKETYSKVKFAYNEDLNKVVTEVKAGFNIIYRVDCIEKIITILLENFPDGFYFLQIYGDTLLLAEWISNNGFATKYNLSQISGEFITIDVLNNSLELIYSEKFRNPCNTIYYDCKEGLVTKDATEVYVDGQLVSGNVYLEDGEYAIEVRKGNEVYREVIRVQCCEYWRIQPTFKIVKRECKEFDQEEITVELCGFTVGVTYIIFDTYGNKYTKIFNNECDVFTFNTSRGNPLTVSIVNDKYVTLPYLKNTNANNPYRCGETYITVNNCGDDCVIDYSYNCFCTDYNSFPPYNGIGSIAIKLKYPGEYKFKMTPDPLTNFGDAVYPLDGSYYIADPALPYYSLPIIVDGLYIVEIINSKGEVCKTLEFDVKCGSLQYDCELGLQSPPAEIYLLAAEKLFITPTIDNKNLFFPELVSDNRECGSIQLGIQQKIDGNAIYRNICNACCCLYLDILSTICDENNKAKVFVSLGYNPLYQKGLYPKTLELGGFPNGPITFNVNTDTRGHSLWIEGLDQGAYEFYLRDLTYNSIKYEDVVSREQNTKFLKDCVITRKGVINCSPCDCTKTILKSPGGEIVGCVQAEKGINLRVQFNFDICFQAVGKTYIKEITYLFGKEHILNFDEYDIQAQIDKGSAVIEFPLETNCSILNNTPFLIKNLVLLVDREECVYNDILLIGTPCYICKDLCPCCDMSKVKADVRVEYTCAEGPKNGERRIRIYNEELFAVNYEVYKIINCKVSCCSLITDDNSCIKLETSPKKIITSGNLGPSGNTCFNDIIDHNDFTGCYIVKFIKATDTYCVKCVKTKLVFK